MKIGRPTGDLCYSYSNIKWANYMQKMQKWILAIYFIFSTLFLKITSLVHITILVLINKKCGTQVIMEPNSYTFTVRSLIKTSMLCRPTLNDWYAWTYRPAVWLSIYLVIQFCLCWYCICHRAYMYSLSINTNGNNIHTKGNRQA